MRRICMILVLLLIIQGCATLEGGLHKGLSPATIALLRTVAGAQKGSEKWEEIKNSKFVEGIPCISKIADLQRNYKYKEAEKMALEALRKYPSYPMIFASLGDILTLKACYYNEIDKDKKKAQDARRKAIAYYEEALKLPKVIAKPCDTQRNWFAFVDYGAVQRILEKLKKNEKLVFPNDIFRDQYLFGPPARQTSYRTGGDYYETLFYLRGNVIEAYHYKNGHYVSSLRSTDQ